MAVGGARYAAGIGSDTLEVTLDSQGGVAVAGFDGLAAARLGRDEYRVALGDAVLHLYAAAADEGVWVFVDGQTFLVEVSRAAAGRRGPAHHHDTLAAPMPATVVKVMVEPGARVAAGDLLVLLEAMKMEMPIRAPADGLVSAVRCREGELVPPGTVLVELDA